MYDKYSSRDPILSNIVYLMSLSSFLFAILCIFAAMSLELRPLLPLLPLVTSILSALLISKFYKTNDPSKRWLVFALISNILICSCLLVLFVNCFR